MINENFVPVFLEESQIHDCRKSITDRQGD
jgi:hypothetical protein